MDVRDLYPAGCSGEVRFAGRGGVWSLAGGSKPIDLTEELTAACAFAVPYRRRRLIALAKSDTFRDQRATPRPERETRRRRTKEVEGRPAARVAVGRRERQRRHLENTGRLESHSERGSSAGRGNGGSSGAGAGAPLRSTRPVSLANQQIPTISFIKLGTVYQSLGCSNVRGIFNRLPLCGVSDNRFTTHGRGVNVNLPHIGDE